jgi:hypothetical protein
MFLMYADEADQVGSDQARHFIYGAVFIRADKAAAISAAIANIRHAHGFNRGDVFKFASSSRPDHVSIEAHRNAKAAVLKCAGDHAVVFCAYATPHAIAKAQNLDQRVMWGANVLLERFNRFCADAGTYGIVLFDRMPISNEFAFHADKFTVGLTFPGGASTRLENILSLGSTCNNASHFSSLADVLVGSFRYCVNQEPATAASAAMFPQLVRLMWQKRQNGVLYVRGLGINFLPRTITHEAHKADREALIERLNGYLDLEE